MAGEEPEVGDKASWNWNGSAPSGEVAEKKDEGEVTVQSKRGNTIKKAAQPNDPAIHLARPGNDVVKNQSELNVEEKRANGGDEDAEDIGDDREEEEEEEGEGEGANGEAESAKTGEKRKATDDAEGDGEGAKKAKGRGRPKGSTSTPKKAAAKEPAKKRGKPAAEAKSAAADSEKKAPAARGRPKKEGGATKEAKPRQTKQAKSAKPKAPATGIGKRTRSGGK